MKQKIIKSDDGNKIINGLKKIKALIDKGSFEFKEKYEDIHLNIEKNGLKAKKIMSNVKYNHNSSKATIDILYENNKIREFNFF